MNVVRRNRALDGRETVADLGGGLFLARLLGARLGGWRLEVGRG